MGILLVILVLFRCYFAYFALGFGAALIVCIISSALEMPNDAKPGRSSKQRAALLGLCNLMIVVAVSLATLGVPFPQFLLKSLATNYSQHYTAYDDPLSSKAISLLSKYGFVSLLLVLVGAIFAFRGKAGRWIYLELLTSIAVSVFFFFRVQNMYSQHFFIINTQVFLVEYLGLVAAFEIGTAMGQRTLAHAISATAVAIYALCFIQSYVLPARAPTGFAAPVLSTEYNPMVRDDIDTLDSLVLHLNEMTEGTSDTIYVTASSFVINDDILRSVYKPAAVDAVPNLSATCHVDLHDGFPSAFLGAQIVVSASPVQTHLDSGQEVVTFLTEEVQDADSPIGRHFQLESSFQLDSGVVANVYVKTSSFVQSDLQYMSDYFSGLYCGEYNLFSSRVLASDAA